MSSESQGDFEEPPSCGDHTRTLVLSTPTNQPAAASSARSPEADWLPFFQLLLLRKSPTSTVFKSHICRENLATFPSDNPESAAYTMRRGTALGLYLTWSRRNADGNNMERLIDLLLSCAACMSELCMIFVVKADALTEHASGKFHTPTKPCRVESTSLLEAVLLRAPTAHLPCFYNACGPAEFPCLKLDVCRCLMRPLYGAIYFSNAEMVSTLLRFGAEVRPEDTCHCEEPLCMHPLVRVYTTLTGIYCTPARAAYWLKNRLTSESVLRCHQLAALVMPCHDTELREACYTLVKALTPPEEYESVLREKGSLKHFCRLALRASLSRRRAMPKGVEDLPLPKRLQSYILYQHGPGCE